MIYDLTQVKQLKLSTGEEIICEILEEDEYDIIVRNSLAIQFASDVDGQRMWSFRLFMCYQDDPDRFILLKVDKIVSIANPVPAIMKQYVGAVETMMDYEGEDPFGDESQAEPYEMLDSDSDNVIKFPTLH